MGKIPILLTNPSLYAIRIVSKYLNWITNTPPCGTSFPQKHYPPLPRYSFNTFFTFFLILASIFITEIFEKVHPKIFQVT